MSRKNRAFALAVATAALVGVSVPVANAATFGGPTSGFNNDSLLNASGNQVPLQACNNDIPVNAGVLAGQLPLSDISAILGLVNSGSLTSSVTRNCTQTPSQAITSTTSTGNTVTTTTHGPMGSDEHGNGDRCGCDHNSGSDHNSGHRGTSAPTSGFNNDSLVNLSNNQLPVQACNNDIPVNAGLGVVQVPVDGVSGALGLLNSGPISSSVTRNCAQAPTQTNGSTTTTGNTITNG
jgi:hypothetical protein